MMNTQLNPVIAHQRSAELHRTGDQARLAREVSAGQGSSGDAERSTRRGGKRDGAIGETRFTLHGRHIAKLDRFIGQARRAAVRAEREFEGVSIEVDDHGTVSVHAIGMRSMLL
jgi:hypothetical protein